MKNILFLFTNLLSLSILSACSNSGTKNTLTNTDEISEKNIPEYKRQHDIDVERLNSILSKVNNGIENKSDENIENTPLNTTQKLWLNSHNELRRQHQTGQLKWSHNIARRAQKYANTCPKGHSISGGKYGENIAFATYEKQPNEVVNEWYNEISLYDYIHPEFNTETGHFTQLIWKNTTHIGCGYKSKCHGKFSKIWICQYEPAGNIIGEFAINVRPLSIRTLKND